MQRRTKMHVNAIFTLRILLCVSKNKKKIKNVIVNVVVKSIECNKSDK